jgi:zinc protease
MISYEITHLPTSLPVILSPIGEAPRCALAVTLNGGVRRETIPGTAKMASRLLLKGTETRSAEALAVDVDERELPTVLDIIKDILFHATLADFDKELERQAGEIHASLDLPAEIAQDLLLRTLFAGHPYGNSGTRMLEAMEHLNVDIVRAWYAAGLSPQAMNVTLVGDITPHEVLPRLEETFAELPMRPPTLFTPALHPPDDDIVVTQARQDAQQAQVYQGWYAPSAGTPEQAPMTVMNTILGGAGLSSRLFSELRDKQGLAYTVRSQYAPMRQTGQFLVSIGTSPENIARARAGFAEQITRMQQEPITLEELQNAKGRLRGSYVLSHETTSQYCLDLAISHISGLGPDYGEQLLQRIAGVTVADVQAMAQRIVPPSVTAIVARADALPTE